MNTKRSRFRFSLGLLLAMVRTVAAFLGGWQLHKRGVSREYSAHVDFLGEDITLRGPQKETDYLADLIRQIERL